MHSARSHDTHTAHEPPVYCPSLIVLCQQSAPHKVHSTLHFVPCTLPTICNPHRKGIVHGTLYIVSNLRPLSPMYFVYRTPSAHCYIAIYVHSYIVALLYRYIAMVRCTLDFACWNVDGGGGGYRSSGSYAGEAEHCKRDKTVLPVRT